MYNIKFKNKFSFLTILFQFFSLQDFTIDFFLKLFQIYFSTIYILIFQPLIMQNANNNSSMPPRRERNNNRNNDPSTRNSQGVNQHYLHSDNRRYVRLRSQRSPGYYTNTHVINQRNNVFRENTNYRRNDNHMQHRRVYHSDYDVRPRVLTKEELDMDLEKYMKGEYVE